MPSILNLAAQGLELGGHLIDTSAGVSNLHLEASQHPIHIS